MKDYMMALLDRFCIESPHEDAMAAEIESELAALREKLNPQERKTAAQDRGCGKCHAYGKPALWFHQRLPTGSGDSRRTRRAAALLHCKRGPDRGTFHRRGDDGE